MPAAATTDRCREKFRELCEIGSRMTAAAEAADPTARAALEAAYAETLAELRRLRCE